MYKLRFLIHFTCFALTCTACVSVAKATNKFERNHAVMITSTADTIKIAQKTQDKKEQATKQSPAKKPDIATVPKARKQSRPKVVTPKANVKPIKVIRPKIKRP